ncbi:Threonine dehydratase [Alloactinosynnema sp. L-07]|uniref:threonine ammonia-lyase n=1 Tax=Alloactinosynnema sp. L-07 TaxID=1653480 RepID=UPI00065EF3EE|nr:threonine/serine dehydratase [Alloactinosynnema sp. L-07]CRK57294.1 Threonine dehydratase [Alloactinosynnema sp. L-07]
MTAADTRLGPADIAVAADRIRRHVRRTPLLTVDGLRGLLFKAEHLQTGRSFKTRGAANALLGHRGRDVVTGSSGNHGIAVATLGAALGVGVTVVMAAGADPGKAAAVRAMGAEVITVAGGVVEREQRAREHAARTGAMFVPSSDHELIVAGQGTVGREILDDAPGVDTIFVPTGGGGLLAGICLAADRPVRVVGVEPADARRYALSVAADRLIEVPPPATVADGLRGQRPGEIPFPIIQRRVDDLIGVGDDEITHAARLLRRGGIEAEPSGAVALAGALRAGFRGTAVAIVSGGNTPRSLSTTEGDLP